MGMLKRRVMPEHVIINCSKDSKIPEPPAGHKWKEVKHDNTVSIISLFGIKLNINCLDYGNDALHLSYLLGYMVGQLDGECSGSGEICYVESIVEIERREGLAEI